MTGCVRPWSRCAPARPRRRWPITRSLFVDDGSIDGSFAVLEELAASDPRVKVVQLRRNFGQTPALQAGIDWSSGDVLVTMDGDLQNDPADIPDAAGQAATRATTPCSACARTGRTTC